MVGLKLLKPGYCVGKKAEHYTYTGCFETKNIKSLFVHKYIYYATSDESVWNYDPIPRSKILAILNKNKFRDNNCKIIVKGEHSNIYKIVIYHAIYKDKKSFYTILLE